MYLFVGGGLVVSKSESFYGLWREFWDVVVYVGGNCVEEVCGFVEDYDVNYECDG